MKKKMEADKKYKEALELGLAEDARKYSQGINKLDTNMIEDSKELIRLFGFPVVEAPCEGEAQASDLVKKGKVWAAASQDFDSLLFGAKFLIRNLSVSAKRKVAGSSAYRDIPIEFFDLDKNLERLHITNDDLIIVAILCGTDFNVGGVKGIGPKKALKLVKEYRDRWDDLFKNLDWYEYFDYPWIEVFNTFKKMQVKEVEDIDYGQIKKKEIKEFLMKKDFDETMLDRSLNSIKEVKTLDKFF